MTDHTTAADLRHPSDDGQDRFLSAEIRGRLDAAEHVARYRWASAHAEGRRVLDAGCGSGQGSDMLSRAGAAEVVGVDRSESVLELARAHVSRGVVLETGDVTDLACADDDFDLVVCFDVLQHLDDPGRALDELARVLRPDGLLLVSAPNRDPDDPDRGHRVHDLARPGLQALLDARFARARVLSQHLMLSSVISWSAASPAENALLEPPGTPAAEAEQHLLGMAGAALPADRGPVVAFGGFSEPRRWLDHIELQRRTIKQQARELNEMRARDADRQAALERLAEAEQRLAAADAQSAEAEETRRALTAATDELHRVRAREAEQSSQLDRILSSRTWRVATRVRRLREQIGR